ncbi:MAG: hypothetical protein AWM53_00639 [Candidatus Dichloromethanomonas elyunquensis]|nr:MAG: hypothetical protein AWM53_00639 [Candidatus Dichloromethanomonas elyunquensis]
MNGLNNKGFVSLFILLILVFFSWQGISVFVKASSNERMARLEAQKLKASYAADSGLAYAKAVLRTDPEWNGGTKELTEGLIIIEVQQEEKEYTVSSRAQIGNSTQIRYGKYVSGEDGALILKEYGEMYQ